MSSKLAGIFITMMLAAGIAAGYANSASAKHPPGCSRVRDPIPHYTNQVPCPIRDPLEYGLAK